MMDRTKWNQRTPTSWIAVTALLVFACFWVACGGGAGSANSSSWEKAITPPKLTGISPASGPTTGGTTVAVTGTDFQQGATVVFGDVPAAKINSVTSTSIEAVAPVHDPGKVDVKVTNPDTRSDTLLAAFTFEGSPPPIVGPAPTISSVLPNSGPVIGGTVVTITGTDFQSGATVTFGQTPAAVVFSSATQLLATTPAHAQGIVDVIVRNPDTQSAPVSGGFTYQPVPAPTISGLQPTSGPTVGGTLVRIAGANFLAAATVSFGGEPATPVTVTSSTQIDTVTPAHAAGVVDVWVTNLDSQLATLASGFTYVLPPPTISGISPTTGPIGGGTVVTITGTNFQNGATVTFAGVAATSATVNSSTRIAATTPAHAAGTVAVNVTNPDAQSATLPGAFTYTSGAITAGCGAGTDNSDCGNVGDPYEGGSFNPSGKTALSACGTLSGSTDYYLTGDIGADQTADCITLPFNPGTGLTLDLRGHTIQGTVQGVGINQNGITIFNGTILCNTFDMSCLRVSGNSNYSAKTRLHHLTAHNSINPDPLTTGFSAISTDFAGLDGTNTALEVDHITCYVGTAPVSNRALCLAISSQKKADIHNNDLTCTANTKACNLIQYVSTHGYVNTLIHNNKVTITTNTVYQGVPRAIYAGGPDGGSIGAQGIQVYNNYCVANNGRCFRFRQVNNLEAYNNEVLNCASTMTYGCYHFADPSNGTSYVGDAQTTIHNETVHLDTGGVGFWLREGNGWSVKDVTIVGTHGKLGQLNTPGLPPPGGPVPTSATFCRISGASGLDTDSTAHANTTVNIFDAGTWAGAGTINVLGSCP